MDPYQRPPGNQPQVPWSGQYNYHPQSAPPPYPAAPTPPPPPYPSHYPTPPPHQLPLRPPPSQPYYQQSYHQPQEWGSGSSSHHHSWYYAENSNAEDWAAKARAWAAAKSASESQHQQPQFVQAGQPEVLNHYVDQYSQANTQFSDDHTRTAQAPNYQNYPSGIGVPNGASHAQMKHGESSYAANVPVPYAARDESSVGNAVASFPQPEKSSPSPFVHQQEVPSSYSSVPGNEEASNRYEQFNNSSSLPVASITQHHVHLLPPSGGSQTAESLTDLSNQPLNFAPRFNGDLDPHVPSNYSHSPSGADPIISPNYAWGPSSASGTVYPPVHPLMPSLPTVDQQIHLSSHASAPPALAFPTGPAFQPPSSMVGGALGASTGLTSHPTASSVNGYGTPGFHVRPKKASVPNWLREEIIKNKSFMKNGVPEISQAKYSEEDSFNGSYEKRDHADDKSIDSPRSSEGEDFDEDEEEAARTTAINQEIKRILTEVLLKVTDELFDEIATKVLKEDNSSDLAPPTPVSVTPNDTAKVQAAKITMERNNEDSSEKSASVPPGGILGLANYASDEDDEEQSPDLPNSTTQQQSSSMISEGSPINENGDVHEEVDHSVTKLDADGPHKSSPVTNTSEFSATNKDFDYNAKEKEIARGDSRSPMCDDPTMKITGAKLPESNGHENRIGPPVKGHNDSEVSREKQDTNSNEVRTLHETVRSPDSDLRGKGKEKGRSAERSIKESDSRKRSPSVAKERNRGEVDNDERRLAHSRDERKERSRHRSERESGRHKQRRRSPSVSHANDSIDESSDDSKRKSHHSRRRRSPSPVRHRKRDVSRSPRSKHSKHSHSPYSSLENTRRRRSPLRSRSPVHRRR